MLAARTARWLVPAALLLALFCLAGSAAAAQPNAFSFDRFGGQVLAVGSGKVGVEVDCGLASTNECHGRVSVLPRGEAVATLGSGPVASSRGLQADRGEDLEPRLSLDEDALSWLRQRGPLPVTVELRRRDGKTLSKSMFVARVELVKAPAPTRKVLASASDASLVTQSYSWDFKLKAGTAVVLRQFRCPDSASFVARGSKSNRAGRPGDFTVKASDGVGYGAFDIPTVKAFWEPGTSRYWTLAGWPEGSLWHNNVFAPLFTGGTFSMTVLCTNSNPSGFDDGGGNPTQEKYVGPPTAASIFQVWGRSEEAFPTSLLFPWQ